MASSDLLVCLLKYIPRDCKGSVLSRGVANSIGPVGFHFQPQPYTSLEWQVKGDCRLKCFNESRPLANWFLTAVFCRPRYQIRFPAGEKVTFFCIARIVRSRKRKACYRRCSLPSFRFSGLALSAFLSKIFCSGLLWITKILGASNSKRVTRIPFIAEQFREPSTVRLDLSIFYIGS